MTERATPDKINDVKRDNIEGFEARAPHDPSCPAMAGYVDSIVWTLCQPFSTVR
jgi:hypothetical protein